MKVGKGLARNASSECSSDYCPSESCQTPSLDCEISSHHTQQAGAAKKARSPQPSDPGPSPQLPSVKALWLKVGHGEPDYLLLEDLTTGDVLMPLLHVKRVITGNFSRKLASYTARLVTEPEAGLGGRTPQEAWYWRKAFESPKNVKQEVKRALGEDASTAGHISIVLLPIVYNAIVAKEKEYLDDSKEKQAKCRDFPWKSHFFVEVEKLLRESSYSGLLKKREGSPASPRSKGTSMHTRSNSLRSSVKSEGASDAGKDQQPLFKGPIALKKTQAKYMFTFKNERARQNSRGTGSKNKRGAEMPLIPLHPAGSAQLDDRLAVIQEELKESKRQRRAQDAKIEDLERKLGTFEILLTEHYPNFAGNSLERADHPLRARQLGRQHRSHSTETISSAGPPTRKDWGAGFPHIDIDRRPSAPPEIPQGIGNVEMSPSPSYHNSTPLHGQPSGMHMEHSGSDLTPRHPFKPHQLPSVNGGHGFLQLPEDLTDGSQFTAMDYGSATRPPHRAMGTMVHPFNIPPHYGQQGFPILGNMGHMARHNFLATPSGFDLGPEDMNRR